MALTISEQIILKEFGEFITEKIKFDIRNKDLTKFGEINSSGELADSIRFEVTDTGLTIFGADYIFFLVNGRKPGKFPPKDDILRWIKQKPIIADIPDDSLAFLIGRKIANKGTTIFEQGGSDLISSIITQSLIDDITEEMGGVFIKEITSEIVKTFNVGKNISARV